MVPGLAGIEGSAVGRAEAVLGSEVSIICVGTPTGADGSTDLAKQFSWDKLVAVVVPMIARIVDLHNALGLFQKPAQANNA